MPAQWTADLIGKMHLAGVTSKQLAAKVGWNEKYLSTVLNGHKEPRKAEETLNRAFDALIADRAAKQGEEQCTKEENIRKV